MSEGVVFTKKFVVNTCDSDLWNQCRPSAMLGYLQEAGTWAAEDMGLTRQRVSEDYGCFWMVSRLWYRLNRPIYGGEELTIRTWHRGGRGVALYRDFDLYCQDELVGEAVSVWVLAQLDGHALYRLSKVSEVANGYSGPQTKDKKLHAIRLPDTMEWVEQRRLHYSETDVNGHINNTRYADFACDALALEDMGEGRFVSALQMGFLAECRAKETLDLSVGTADGAQVVRGVGPDGVARFDATVAVMKIGS